MFALANRVLECAMQRKPDALDEMLAYALAQPRPTTDAGWYALEHELRRRFGGRRYYFRMNPPAAVNEKKRR